MDIGLESKAIEASKTSADADKWVMELKARASGIKSHYKGRIDFRFAGDTELPELGFLGNPKGFYLSRDVEKRYQFISEYASVSQELSYFNYSKIKMMESVEPTALSSLMTMVLEKRKALEDRTMQLLGNVYTVLKSIISIIYELKEMDRNLSFYDIAKSHDPDKASAAELGLKRIFVDNIDSRKGGASMLSLSKSATQGQGAGYIDIVAVFYSVKSLRDINSMNRNKQFIDTIKNRYLEYEEWKKLNEKDLRTRRELLLQYLRSQVASFQLYVEWTSQYLSILRRINLKTIRDAKSYKQYTKLADVSEAAMFYVTIMGFKYLYRGEYDAEYSKIFGSRGPEIPVAAKLKSPVSSLLSRAPREESRSFIYNRIRKYGPVVVPAIEISFAFKEKQMFTKEDVLQQKSQYEGTLDLQINNYCFSLDEWYLFNKALEMSIKRTVFDSVSQISSVSLNAIQEDLNKYIKEAESRDKPKEKKQSQFAILDIYQAFKDDFTGINKAISSVSNSNPKKQFDKDLYEVMVNSRMWGKKMEDTLALGLFVSHEDASTIYEEFKRRSKLLNPLSKFDLM